MASREQRQAAIDRAARVARSGCAFVRHQAPATVRTPRSAVGPEADAGANQEHAVGCPHCVTSQEHAIEIELGGRPRLVGDTDEADHGRGSVRPAGLDPQGSVEEGQ